MSTVNISLPDLVAVLGGNRQTASATTTVGPKTRKQAREAAAAAGTEPTLALDTKNKDLRVFDVNDGSGLPLGFDEGKLVAFPTKAEMLLVVDAMEKQETQVALIEGRLVYALVDPTKATDRNVGIYRSFQKVESVEEADVLEVRYVDKQKKA